MHNSDSGSWTSDTLGGIKVAMTARKETGMNTETHSSGSRYVRRFSKQEGKLEALKRRTRASKFRFKITVDDVQRWAVFDKATWDFMKYEILAAIETSRSWSIEDMAN